MILSKEMIELICELENCIGSQCYNPNSYNGWTGKNGYSYRYPVQYCKTAKDYTAKKSTKTDEKIDEIDPRCIGTMKYAFGANHLYIGDGIIEVLELLEKKFGLDFNQLLGDPLPENLDDMVSKIQNNEPVLLWGKKKLIAGIDIPVGTMEVRLSPDCRFIDYNHLFVYSNNKFSSGLYIHSELNVEKLSLAEGDYVLVYDPSIPFQITNIEQG